MTLGIWNDMIDGLDNIFSNLEEFIANHAANPILWILIMAVLLVIVACAYNTLSK